MNIAKLKSRLKATSHGCWEWTRARKPDGYGWVTVAGKQMGAHRLAWKLFVGPIPAGKKVLHRCDNPPCCNPKHLFIGTQADNVQDMWSKHRHPKTSGGCAAKLTVAEVKQIRKLLRTTLQKDIATKYGVKQETISAIKTGRNWSWV